MTKKPFRASKASGVLALLILVATGAVFTYWRVGVEQAPGDYEVKKGNYRLEDGQFTEAIGEFNRALEVNPNHIRAYHGLAVTNMQMGHMDRALGMFDRALAIDPTYAVVYADRGIAFDRVGRHEEALQDYRKALELNPDLEKGPGLIWRFLRNISERPPSIKDRADYIEEQLQKPPGERLLTVPEKDDEQLMYK